MLSTHLEAIWQFITLTGGVGERVDSTRDPEGNESGSAGERETSSTEGSEEYETESEALSEEVVHCSKD